MHNFPWFPLGYNLPIGRVGPLRKEGSGYQIIGTQGTDKVALVLERGSLASNGVEQLLDPSTTAFRTFEFGGQSYLSGLFEKETQPIVISEYPRVMGLPTSSELSSLGSAIQRTREVFPKADIRQALYLSSSGKCLPTNETEKQQDIRSLAIELLVAAAPISTVDVASIRSINSWLTQEEVESFFSLLNIEVKAGIALAPTIDAAVIDPTSFVLPGRPELEKFFREYILAPSMDRERYAALGVKTPNGILLYGPPGSGKSHAVRKLKAALNWPTFEIDLGAVGSPFIHQTTVAIRKVFDEAKRRAPAIIVLEEIDALATSRNPATHDHKKEELAELLRLIEGASDNKILVIATTNWRQGLDEALLRKGRFDHMIEVGYPSAVEVQAALEAMLHDRPHREVPNLVQLSSRLANRPMSDVAWVINEASRLAARGMKDAIDEIDLFSAIERLQKT